MKKIAQNRILQITLIFLLMLVSFSQCECSDDDLTPNNTGLDLELNSEPLRLALVGDLYSKKINPTGGTTPYEYYINLGDLPPGLSYQGYSGELSITGSPEVAGNFDFTVVVTDYDNNTVSASYTLNVYEEFDIAGTWAYTMVVTQANGNCAGEVGNSYTHELTIVQDGSNVTFSGFHGNPASQLTGTSLTAVYDIVVSGSYEEDGGITTSEHKIHMSDLYSMWGTEFWTWEGGGDVCNDGEANITAYKLN